MADTSQQELSEPHTNGVIDGLTEEEKSKMRPADIDADMREMERRKRVEMMMNSRLFREELERIIETQMKDGAGPSGLLQQISDMMGAQGGRFNTNVFKNTNCVVPINDIRGVESMGYAKGEKVLRCKLAAVFRLLDLYGWTQGVSGLISARLNQDQEHFLLNPYGLLYHEVTASSLIKVDMQGAVVEQGTTNFGVHVTGFQLHSTIHAARPDVKCVVHITTPSVVAVSSLKCGLLPLGQESIVIGEVSTHQYIGAVYEPEEREKITRNLGPVNKVMFLTNRGALCCGETVEEAFYNVYNTVLACETQLKLIPVGLDNLNLVSEETRKTIFEASRKPPAALSASVAEPSPLAEKLEKRWRIGGTEFEALMRMLDNAGFRTGYIYKHPLVKGEPPRPRNDVEVPPAVSSLGYLLEEEELYRQGLWKGGRKGTDRTRWLNSPNVYQKVEILETGTPDPKKITKWVDQNAEEWVTDGSPTHSSTPVKIDGALQFVPKNTNPKEFKQLQQQIKDYRRADKISAGPQSHILEGVTWDEAKKMQDATISGAGEQVVLVGAASKGIIQRGFQHNAMVYKTPYAKNPFDAITDQELDQYKKEVERKQKGDPYDESQSESEALSSFNMSRATHESSTAKSPIQSPVSVTSETEEESRDEPRVLRIEKKQVPAPSQPEVVLSDEQVAVATSELPVLQQVQIPEQQFAEFAVTQQKTTADATTEFLTEMRRSAMDPKNSLSRRDCQSSSCSSTSSEQSYGWRPESCEAPRLEVTRSTTVARSMRPLLIDVSPAPPSTKLPISTTLPKLPPPVPPKPKPYLKLRRAFFNEHQNITASDNHSIATTMFSNAHDWGTNTKLTISDSHGVESNRDSAANSCCCKSLAEKFVKNDRNVASRWSNGNCIRTARDAFEHMFNGDANAIASMKNTQFLGCNENRESYHAHSLSTGRYSSTTNNSHFSNVNGNVITSLNTDSNRTSNNAHSDNSSKCAIPLFRNARSSKSSTPSKSTYLSDITLKSVSSSETISQRITLEQTDPVDYSMGQTQQVSTAERLKIYTVEIKNCSDRYEKAIDYSIPKSSPSSWWSAERNIRVGCRDSSIQDDHCNSILKNTVLVARAENQHTYSQSVEHVNIAMDNIDDISSTMYENCVLFNESECMKSPCIVSGILKNVNELHTICRGKHTDLSKQSLESGSTTSDNNGNVAVGNEEKLLDNRKTVDSDIEGNALVDAHIIIVDTMDDSLSNENEKRGILMEQTVDDNFYDGVDTAGGGKECNVEEYVSFKNVNELHTVFRGKQTGVIIHSDLAKPRPGNGSSNVYDDENVAVNEETLLGNTNTVDVDVEGNMLIVCADNLLNNSISSGIESLNKNRNAEIFMKNFVKDHSDDFVEPAGVDEDIGEKSNVEEYDDVFPYDKDEPTAIIAGSEEVLNISELSVKSENDSENHEDYGEFEGRSEDSEEKDLNGNQSDVNGNSWMTIDEDIEESTNVIDEVDEEVNGNSWMTIDEDVEDVNVGKVDKVENLIDLLNYIEKSFNGVEDKIEQRNDQSQDNILENSDCQAPQGFDMDKNIIEEIPIHSDIEEMIDSQNILEKANMNEMSSSEIVNKTVDLEDSHDFAIADDIENNSCKTVKRIEQSESLTNDDVINKDYSNDAERDFKTPSPCKSYPRQDSLTEVINSIKMNLTPTKMLLDALPGSNISLKYNLNSANMSLIYSLTPNTDVELDQYDGSSSKNTSFELLDCSFDDTEFLVNSDQDDKEAEYMWVDLVTSTQMENTPPVSLDLNKTVDLFDSSVESMVEFELASDQGSDILELPMCTVKELRDHSEDCFNNDISQSANEIIADLHDIEIHSNAMNLVDEILHDVSFFNLDGEVDRNNVHALVQDKLLALNIAKEILNVLVSDLPCFVSPKGNDIDVSVVEVFCNLVGDNEGRRENTAEVFNVSDNSVVVIDEIVHHIVDKFVDDELSLESSKEIYNPKQVKETTNTELKEMQDSCRLEESLEEDSNFEKRKNEEERSIEFVCCGEYPQAVSTFGIDVEVTDQLMGMDEEQVEVDVARSGSTSRLAHYEDIFSNENSGSDSHSEVIKEGLENGYSTMPEESVNLSEICNYKFFFEDCEGMIRPLQARESEDCLRNTDNTFLMSDGLAENPKNVSNISLQLKNREKSTSDCSDSENEVEQCSNHVSHQSLDHSPLDCDCEECELSDRQYYKGSSDNCDSNKENVDYNCIESFVPYTKTDSSSDDPDLDLTDHDSLGDAIIKLCTLAETLPKDEIHEVGNDSIFPIDAKPIEDNCENFTTENQESHENDGGNQVDLDDVRSKENSINESASFNDVSRDNFVGSDSPLSEIHSSGSDNFAEREITPESTNSDTKSDSSKEKTESHSQLDFCLIEYIGEPEVKNDATSELSQFWEMIQNEEEGSCVDVPLSDETYVQFEEVDSTAECSQCTCCLDVRKMNFLPPGHLPSIIEETDENFDTSTICTNNQQAGPIVDLVEENVAVPGTLEPEFDYLDFLTDSERLIARWFNEYIESAEGSGTQELDLDIPSPTPSNLSLESPNTLDYFSCKEDSSSTLFHSLQTTITSGFSTKPNNSEEDSVEFVQESKNLEEELDRTYTISDDSVNSLSVSDNEEGSRKFLDATYNADVSANMDESQVPRFFGTRKSDSTISDPSASNDHYFDISINFGDESAETFCAETGRENDAEDEVQDCMAHSYDTREFLRLERALQDGGQELDAEDEHAKTSLIFSPLDPPPRYEDTTLCRVVSRINLTDISSNESS